MAHSTILRIMRATHHLACFFALLGLGTSVFAQDAKPEPASPSATSVPPIEASSEPSKAEQRAAGRANQRIEHIKVEDEGSRIEELRVGGQTTRITVQPKSGNAPEYEIKPPDATRGQAGTGNDSQVNTAPPVWNIKKF